MEAHIIFEVIYLQFEEFIAKSFEMKEINSNISRGIFIFREACKGSLEKPVQFSVLGFEPKKRWKWIQALFRSWISIYSLFAIIEVFLLAQHFTFITMDNSKVVNSLDRFQVNLRKYLKNLSKESVGAFSCIPPRVFPI